MSAMAPQPGLVRDVAARLAGVEARIAEACRAAGRPRDAVTLVAVTKTRTPEEVLAAYACGLRQFGENRPEELEARVTALGPALPRGEVLWHMIGHIQSRKADRVVAHADLVHSVDSTRLAARLDRLAGAAGRVLPVLLELNVSGEASKYGFPASEPPDWRALPGALAPLAGLDHLQIRGLMTMAPQGASPQQAREVFRALRVLAERLRREQPWSDWAELSMGMSDDLEAAIAEGATMVRVGRAIFGPLDG